MLLMKKSKKPTAQEVIESSEGQFFVERFANILLRQIEHEAAPKLAEAENETVGETA